MRGYEEAVRIVGTKEVVGTGGGESLATVWEAEETGETKEGGGASD